MDTSIGMYRRPVWLAVGSWTRAGSAVDVMRQVRAYKRDRVRRKGKIYNKKVKGKTRDRERKRGGESTLLKETARHAHTHTDTHTHTDGDRAGKRTRPNSVADGICPTVDRIYSLCQFFRFIFYSLLLFAFYFIPDRQERIRVCQFQFSLVFLFRWKNNSFKIDHWWTHTDIVKNYQRKTCDNNNVEGSSGMAIKRLQPSQRRLSSIVSCVCEC